MKPKPSFQNRLLRWLSLSVISLTCLGGAPALAGSTPAGGGSGVTPGGSTSLPSGGAPITGNTTRTTTQTVSLDPNTGSLVLTTAAQASLNQAAAQLLQQLEAANPGLIAALQQPFFVDPDQQVDSIALAIRGINNGEPVAKSTLREAAEATRPAIEQYRWAILYADQNLLELTAPLVVLGSPDQFSLVASFNPDNGVNSSRLVLQGNLEQLGNAAAFLVLTTGSGVSPEAVAPFVDMALAGAPYDQLVNLLNAVNALVVATAAGEDIDPNQLNRAIHAHRAIVETVDQATLNILANNQPFLALGEALQNLRRAVET